VNSLQRNEAWFESRHGKITSSRAHVVVFGGPKGWLSLIDLMRKEMQGERPPELYVDPVVRGRELESAAIANAELILGEEFERVGFVNHPIIPYIGCSSDALARNHAVNVEAKAYSNRERHLGVYMSRQMPRDHMAQVQCQMAVHNADLTLFISHFPEMPHWKMRTVIVEVPRDQSFIDRFYESCDRFIRAFRGERDLVEHVPAHRIPKLF